MDKNVFSVTWELVPGRGAREKAQANAIEAAKEAASEGRIHAVTITDNPGGKPALSAVGLGMEILQLGMEPLVHFTCKDKNRNQIEAELYAMDRAGVRNVLVMTGDYPTGGFMGQAKPVFDLDSVQAMDLIAKMNQGLVTEEGAGINRLKPSAFFAGSVVSPFKATEPELMTQYFKLEKKIAAGAGFVVTQLGFDARKFHEVLQYAKTIDADVPVIGNIYVLPFGAARIMHANQLPGCVVTEELLAQIDRERNEKDQGRSARLLRAAKMYAIMKGMGFDGVHLGGHNIKYEQVRYILEQGEQLSREWTSLLPEFDFPQPGGFYYYQRDPQTGLNTSQPDDRAGRQPEMNPGINYRMMRLLHHWFFTPGRNLFPLMQRYYQGKSNPAKYPLEHALKVAANSCRDCGDCALLDLAYLCPMSQCPKNQRNGPCGGSQAGWCEVFPGKKKCIWSKAYTFMKAHNEESQLQERYIPPVNWELYQTSAWYNYYTGRDHSALEKRSPVQEKAGQEK